MTRRARFLTAIAAAAALLFAQLAVSAYACPMAAPSAAAAAAPEGCGASMGNANLCQGHCDYGSASFEAAKPLHAPQAAIPAGLRITLPDSTALSLPAPAPHASPGPSPPPPRSRFTVLRI